MPSNDQNEELDDSSERQEVPAASAKVKLYRAGWIVLTTSAAVFNAGHWQIGVGAVCVSVLLFVAGAFNE